MKTIKKIILCLSIIVVVVGSLIQNGFAKEDNYEIEMDMQSQDSDILDEIKDMTTDSIDIGNGYVFSQSTYDESSTEYVMRQSDYVLSSGAILDVGTGKDSTYLPGYKCLNVLSNGIIHDWIIVQVLYLNDEEVYCIEPTTYAVDGVSYVPTTDALSQEQQIDLSLIAYFGYGYGSDESMEMHAATQLAIWNYLGYDVWNYNLITQEKVQQILKRLDNFRKYPSFGDTADIVLDGYGEEHAITLTDTNDVLQDYHVYASAGYQVVQDGNSIKIWAEKGIQKEGVIELDRFGREEHAPSIVFKSASGSQTLMKIDHPNPFTSKISVKVNVGDLKIKKHNDLDKPIEGAKFNIAKDENMEDIIGTYTTDKNGEIYVDNLREGTYYYQEIYTPEPYVLDPKVYQTSVTFNDATTVPILNIQQRGSIKVRKEGEIVKGFDFRNTEYGLLYEPIFEKGILDGACFQIRASEDIFNQGEIVFKKGDIVDEFISDVVEYQNDCLYLGSYSLYEISTKAGYVKDEKIRDFTLSYAGQEVNLSEHNETVWNEKQRAKVKISKQIEPSRWLQDETIYEDITYGLFSKEAIYIGDEEVVPQDALLGVAQLDESFQAEFLIDIAGSYYIKELSTNPSYVLDEHKYPVQFSYSENDKAFIELPDLTMKNSLRRGSIRIHKIDNEKQYPIEGVVFGLYSDASCEDVIETKSSDIDGFISFENLEPYTYYVKEVNTPDIYILDDTVHEIIIEEDGQKEELILENEVRRSDIKVKKMDSKSKLPLSNTEFTLYDTYENVIQTKMTDEQGIVEFMDMVNGDYIVKETKAPDGYHISYDEIEVTIDKQDESSLYEVACYDDKIVPTGDTHNVLPFLVMMFASSVVYILLKKRNSFK